MITSDVPGSEARHGALLEDRMAGPDRHPVRQAVGKVDQVCHGGYRACGLGTMATMSRISRPIVTKRTPAWIWNIFNMVPIRLKKSAAPQIPMALACPPATEVPPSATIAMASSR